MENEQIVCWFSGGITSAIACKIAIDLYKLDNCRLIFIDTKNEHLDTYRFLKECEIWYGKKIGIITNENYNSIDEVWYKFKQLNTAHGAICSSELKRAVRLKFQKENKYKHQVFGFDINESKRAKAMKLNYSNASPIFTLLLYGYEKKDCFEILKNANIEPPEMYKKGYHNNNCGKTLCIQGGIGYWQKAKIEEPEKFDKMAKIEHELTNLKGKPVTMLKDQSKKAKKSGNQLVFLKKHPDYPEIKCINDMKGRKVEPLIECNGFCYTNDLIKRSPTELEINFTD